MIPNEAVMIENNTPNGQPHLSIITVILHFHLLICIIWVAEISDLSLKTGLDSANIDPCEVAS
jgi:hypothetical protein